MPEKKQEIAPLQRHVIMEVGVLAGVGVLLLFLGSMSSGSLTTVTSYVIGVFLMFVAYRLMTERSRERDSERETLGTDDFRDDALVSDLTSEHVRDTTVPERDIAPPTHTKSSARPRNTIERPSSFSMGTVEPRSEFHNLLVTVLGVIKEVCFAHTAAFFWINRDAQQLIVEARATDSDSFVPDRKIPAGNDVVSQIGLRATPEVINDIRAETERDLLCYYRSLQDVRSFIGVPVYYVTDGAAESPVGVIAVDSKASDAFGDETFTVLGHFARLISVMLAGSTEKYDLLAEAKLTRAIRRMRTSLGARPAVPVIVNTVMEEVEKAIEWDSLTLVLLDDAQRQWTVASVRTRFAEPFLAPKQPVDLMKSLVGNAIRSSTVQSIDLSRNSSMLFSDGETSIAALRRGWMTLIPVSSNGKCFGVIAAGSASPLGAGETDAIQMLSMPAASALEMVELNSIIAEHVVVDETTGLLTRKFFLHRLTEELHRATDRGEDLSLVLIAISNVQEIASRYGEDGLSAAIQSIGGQLRASIRQYDIAARYDDSTFALVLTDTIASDAFLWAEKLRTAIASSIITTERKSFSVSVTIGISGAAARMECEELMKNAAYVLEQAKRAGGNIVRVF